MRPRKSIQSAPLIPNKTYPITEPNKLMMRMIFRPYLSLNTPKAGAAKNVQTAKTDMSALIPITTCPEGRYLPTMKGKRGSTMDIPMEFNTTIPIIIHNCFLGFILGVQLSPDKSIAISVVMFSTSRAMNLRITFRRKQPAFFQARLPSASAHHFQAIVLPPLMLFCA